MAPSVTAADPLPAPPGGVGPNRPSTRADTGRRRPARRLTGALVAVLGVILFAAPADATWSIVAVDEETGEVGVAIASCVPADLIGDPARPLAPVALVPGIGAGVSQAQFDASAPGRLAEGLATGEGAESVIARLVAEDPESLAAVRQHAAVALDPVGVDSALAVHTGADNQPTAHDDTGDGVAAQGNLLVSEAVIDDALAAYAEARGGATPGAASGLGSALVAALAAGADAGGDRRCGEQTALFAQVAVARSDDAPGEPSTLLTVTVTQGDDQNPVAELAEAWAAGRRGLIDLEAPPSGSGGVLRLAVLAAAVVGVGGALVVIRRGLGSVAARR